MANRLDDRFDGLACFCEPDSPRVFSADGHSRPIGSRQAGLPSLAAPPSSGGP